MPSLRRRKHDGPQAFTGHEDLGGGRYRIDVSENEHWLIEKKGRDATATLVNREGEIVQVIEGGSIELRVPRGNMIETVRITPQRKAGEFNFTLMSREPCESGGGSETKG